MLDVERQVVQEDTEMEHCGLRSLLEELLIQWTDRQRRRSMAEAPRRVQAPASETKESESPQGRSKVCSYTL